MAPQATYSQSFPTSTAPPNSSSSGSLFPTNTPALILAFIAIALFLIAIIVGFGTRLQLSNGRLTLRPVPTIVRRQRDPSNSKTGPKYDRPQLWDVWTTEKTDPRQEDDLAPEEDMKLEANEWNIMPVSAVKTIYESDDVSQDPKNTNETQTLSSFDRPRRFYESRRQKSDVESVSRPSEPPSSSDVQRDTFVDVAVVVAMPRREKREGEETMFEYCLGIERVQLAEDS